MQYEIQEIIEMTIQGVSLRTDNLEGMALIPKQWDAFFKEDILSQIKGNANQSAVFAVYSDYENDQNGKYTFIIGAQTNLSDKQDNLTRVNILEGKYAVFSVPSKEEVITAWQKVWQSDLKRTFIADFEQYDLATGEVKVFVGVKN